VSQAADMTAMQSATHPTPSDRAAAAEAAAQQLLAEEEREAAKAAAKKSKNQKQKVKKQLRQQQQQQQQQQQEEQQQEEQQEEEEEASTAIPEDAGSPTTSDLEKQSNRLEAAVTAGDGISAVAGGISQATPDASSQTLSGSDRHSHNSQRLVSDSEAMFSVADPPVHDLPTADSHGAAALPPRQGASGKADASHAENAVTVTSNFGSLDMADNGQIARLLSCPITKVGAVHGHEEVPFKVSLTHSHCLLLPAG